MSLTVSLELAKKMKELWWNKDDQFTYFYYDWKTKVSMDDINERWDDFDDYLCAPTAQEILDELPRYLMREEFSMRYILLVTPSDELREAYYRDMHKLTNYDDKVVFVENSVAEALWELRCWCKENWHLE